MPPPPDAAPLLELEGITRRFPGVVANDGIDFSVRPGEIHALLGENGAGKSTLMKILAGLLAPDEGTIRWRGDPVQIHSPATAQRLGIGMVHQHFALFEGLTVAENIALSLPRGVPGPTLERRIRAVAGAYGLGIDPARAVFTLSAGEKQRVEIVRVLLQEPALLILDEPTSVLTPQEAEQLFETLRRLAADGRAIVFISHKLDEVRRLCDRATILRAGKVVGECDPRRRSAEQIAEMMLGSRPLAIRAGDREIGRPVLELRGLDARVGAGHRPVRVGELVVHGGEIVGVAGVAGNGQDDLYRVLSGEETVEDPGAIRIDGKPAGRMRPNARRRLRVAFLPEERLGHAAVPDFDLPENALLSNLIDPEAQRGGWIRWPRLKRQAARIVQEFDVRYGSPDAMARTLSGGNLQKFVVGRELAKTPRLLIVNQPTWGVDMGAAMRIRQALLRLAREGAAILIISQDLDELMELCDRLAVLHAGELSEARPVGDWTMETLGMAMTGAAARPTMREAV